MTRPKSGESRDETGRKVGNRFAALLAQWRGGGAERAPILMGIVNVTPDSFSDGGLYADTDRAIAHGKRLIDEGAAILDIGGESTRKGASPVDEDEEKRRVLPVVEGLRASAGLISIDTMKASVAEAAVVAGAHIVNDVRGLQGDEAVAEVAARHGAGVIAMHNPAVLGSAEPLPGDPIRTLRLYFKRSIAIAQAAGIPDDRIVIDPGFGFGKSPEQNLAILARLSELSGLGFPLLAGTSRKSFIARTLGRDGGDRTIATLATGVVATLADAAILRVHDVAEHVDAIRMAAAIRAAGARG